jgi:hypothetical protein
MSSSEMVSRWPVLVTLGVEPGECDEEGRLTGAAVERLFARGRDAYFELCTTVEGSTVEVLASSVDRGSVAPGDGGVTVSVGVVEVFPDSFTMTARVRPARSSVEGHTAASGWCSLSPGGEVSTAMRDEFIALAHGAAFPH